MIDKEHRGRGQPRVNCMQGLEEKLRVENAAVIVYPLLVVTVVVLEAAP